MYDWIFDIYKFLAVLQTFPSITISDRKPVILVPLITIVIITAAKDFFEDWRRHKSDKEENSRKVGLYSPDEKCFKEISWLQLRVGDIVQVFDFVCDLLVI